MEKKVKEVFKYILWTAVAVLLLYFSFRGVDWNHFREALAACHWGYVVLSMVLGLFVLLLRGLRWRMLLLPIDRTTGVATCFNAMNICMIVNLVLPRVGEVVRAGYVTRNSARGDDGRKRAGVEKVLGTVVIDRLWDVVSILAVLVLVIVFMGGRFGEFFSQNLYAGLSGKISLWWVALLAGLLVLGFICLSWRLRDRGRFWGKVWSILSGIGEGLKSCLHMRHGWLFILYTVIIWICYWLMSACILWAVQGIDTSRMGTEMALACEKVAGLGMIDALFLMFAGAISALVPVPGGFGAFHFVVAGALSSLYGIPFEFGIIFATLSHESQVILDIAAGIFSYVWESFRRPVA